MSCDNPLEAIRKEHTMAKLTTKTSDQAVQDTLSLLQDMLGSVPASNVAVRLWDGTTWQPKSESGEPARCTLVLQHPGALRKMFAPPFDLSLGEAYIYNDFDIEGEMAALFPVIEYFLNGRLGIVQQLRYGKRLLSLPKTDQPRPGDMAAKVHGARHSKGRDKQAVTYHYDLSNDFYSLFLDRRMVYTCAYFKTPGDDLDTAQENKLDYVCRKLRLRPGERLLDLGCGWGGLAIYAAQHYGVQVHSVTLSQPQVELARERIAQAGLTDRCLVEVRDYRDVQESNGYDKIAAIGIVEHIGRAMQETYFKHAWRLLRPGGVFLNHNIALHSNSPVIGRNFIQRYVFPDGDAPPLHTTLKAAEITGFEVRDVESLREHYVLTTSHWIRRLEERVDEVRKIAGEETFRIFRLFLSVAFHDFQVGTSNLYQTLLVKTDKGKSGLPLRRDDWYI